jgi:hypothetical protein
VKQPFINLEEKIDRIVGRRLKTPDPFFTNQGLWREKGRALPDGSDFRTSGHPADILRPLALAV